MSDLFFDIEILPQHFQTRFGADRSTICSFGYRWGNEPKSKTIDLLDFEDTCACCGKIYDPFNEKPIVLEAHKIMSKAERVIGHYSDKFDFPYMNTKFMKYGLSPINYVATQDTWRISKKNLKLKDNRLGTIAEYFGLPLKMDTDPIWWFEIIRGCPYYMQEMSKYCRGDVDTLYAVHQKIQSLEPPKYRKAHHNALSCPECKSTKHRMNRRYHTVRANTSMVMLTCNGCGKSWALAESKYESLKNE